MGGRENRVTLGRRASAVLLSDKQQLKILLKILSMCLSFSSAKKAELAHFFIPSTACIDQPQPPLLDTQGQQTSSSAIGSFSRPKLDMVGD